MFSVLHMAEGRDFRLEGGPSLNHKSTKSKNRACAYNFLEVLMFKRLKKYCDLFLVSIFVFAWKCKAI